LYVHQRATRGGKSFLLFVNFNELQSVTGLKATPVIHTKVFNRIKDSKCLKFVGIIISFDLGRASRKIRNDF
jgi:hypothetical protein